MRPYCSRHGILGVMETPLLQTKFHIPPLRRADFVPRPQLIERLNSGLERRLTLVSAPAGFGKTTLVSHWLETLRLQGDDHQSADSRPGPPKAVWLSLDEDDNDLIRFLSYLIAALQQIQSGLGEAGSDLLRSPQPPPPETILTSLLNALADLPETLIVVLDDYHLIESEAIHNTLTFLLDHLSRQVHLILLSRNEPPLALARLRVRGELLELTADDLRFSPEETAILLNQVLRLNLNSADLNRLETRTEGWIAGLRLAALALQSARTAARPQTIDSVVSAFAGDDRYVVDYLAAEVLANLPAEVQRFLLQTSILKRLSGPLCQAVTDQADSQQLLERLEQENLFIVPLDNRRAWYRYHRLFADFLHYRLRQNQSALIPTLNDRAAAWSEANGLIREAIDYALAAQNYDRAAGLIEQYFVALFQTNEVAALSGWLQAIPAEVAAGRPGLAMVYAGAMLLRAQFDEALTWIDTAEKALETWPERRLQTLSPRALQGYIDAIRSTIAVNHGQEPALIIDLSQRALANLPPDDRLLRGAVALNLGDIHAQLNEPEAAQQAFAQAIALTEQPDNLTVHLAALASQGALFERQGDLFQAADIYRRAVEIGQTWGKVGGQTFPAAGKAHVFLARVAFEWNELTEARDHATQGIDGCKRWGHPIHLLDGYGQLIQIHCAGGDLDSAQETLTAARLLVNDHRLRAEQQGQSNNRLTWMVNQVDLAQLQLWLSQGRPEMVERWLAGHPTVLDMPSFGLVRLRLWLAQNRLAEALQWSQRLSVGPAYGGYVAGQLRLWLWQVIILQRQAQLDQAVATLCQALTVAEPGGYRRAFIEVGSSVAQLLPLALAGGISPSFISRLQADFAAERSGDEAQPQTSLAATPRLTASADLIEPLSERELEVLMLIAAGLKYQQIADRLFISLNTVRTHTRHVYGKLDVNSREAAIAKARALKLLA